MLRSWKRPLIAVALALGWAVPIMIVSNAQSSTSSQPAPTIKAGANNSCPSGYVYDPAAPGGSWCRAVSYNAGNKACSSTLYVKDSSGQCQLQSVGAKPDKTCPASPPMFFDGRSNRCKVCYQNRGNPSPDGKEKNQPNKCP